MHTELVEILSDICIRQASVIKDQAFALAALGAEVREDEAAALRDLLRSLIGDWSDDDGKE